MIYIPLTHNFRFTNFFRNIFEKADSENIFAFGMYVARPLQTNRQNATKASPRSFFKFSSTFDDTFFEKTTLRNLKKIGGKYKRWVESCNIRDSNKHKWPSRISSKMPCCSAKYSRTHLELCLNWVSEHKNPQPQMALCGENINYSTILILHKSAHFSFVWLDSDVMKCWPNNHVCCIY